jgi:hypothetical protein
MVQMDQKMVQMDQGGSKKIQTNGGRTVGSRRMHFRRIPEIFFWTTEMSERDDDLEVLTADELAAMAPTADELAEELAAVAATADELAAELAAMAPTDDELAAMAPTADELAAMATIKK